MLEVGAVAARLGDALESASSEPEKPKPPSVERYVLVMSPSVRASCSLNHDSELIRTVMSAPSMLLLVSALIVVVRGETELHVVAEPVVALRADRERVELSKPGVYS